MIIPNKGGDNIYVARLNRETERLETLSIYESGHGSSPRHLAFVPGTPYVLIQNENDGHLCSYRLDRTSGSLTPIDCLDIINREMELTVYSIGSLKQQWGLDVQVHPNGRFVYSNNTAGTVCLSLFDPETGHLSAGGQYVLDIKTMPRGIQIDREGRFLVVTGVQNEEAIILQIDPESGALSAAGRTALPTPTALRFIYV